MIHQNNSFHATQQHLSLAYIHHVMAPFNFHDFIHLCWIITVLAPLQISTKLFEHSIPLSQKNQNQKHDINQNIKTSNTKHQAAWRSKLSGLQRRHGDEEAPTRSILPRLFCYLLVAGGR